MKFPLFSFFTLAALVPGFAGANEDALFFCNVTESLGSSFHPAPEDGSGQSGYGVTKTRVWYLKDIKKGLEIESEIVAGFRTKISIHDSKTWDKDRKEVNLFDLEATVEDEQNGAFSRAENLFTKANKEDVPGLGSFLTVMRANHDRIGIACANRH